MRGLPGPSVQQPLLPGTSSPPLSLQGVTHCAMETAKLGPLAFYKVPPRGAWVGLWGGWERRRRSVVVEPELSRALPPAAQLLHAPGPVLAPERCEPWPPLGSLPGSGFCSSSAVVRVPNRSAGPGSNAPALADHCRRWSVLGPEVQGWVQSPRVTSRSWEGP